MTTYRTITLPNGSQLNVEVASGREARARGLMDRNELAQGFGMLFVFPVPAHHSMWMHRVRFPLDIIWLDSSQVITEILENCQPCPRIPCASLGGRTVSQYAIEVPAGTVAKNRLVVGQRVGL